MIVRSRSTLSFLLCTALALAAFARDGFSQGETIWISSGPNGELGNGGSAEPSVSQDGRFVFFSSWTSDLWGGTDGWTNIWRADRLTGVVTRSSVGTTPLDPNNSSFAPSASADGRFVAFRSGASNLVGGDTNSVLDVFVRDHRAETTERVSVSTSRAQANGASEWASLSADGTRVSFASFATNLVQGDTNGLQDVFVRDRTAGATELVTVALLGEPANGASNVSSMSGDGRYVAFASSASNLVPGDTNGHWDVFVRDRLTGTTDRVSVTSSGAQASADSSSPAITPDGRYVAFASRADDLVPSDANGVADVFVHDRANGTIELVSVRSGGVQANRSATEPSISADGRYVAFATRASSLVPGDTNASADAFVHDRLSGVNSRISLTTGGEQASGDSEWPAISADGLSVAFVSVSVSFPGGGDLLSDVYLRVRNPGTPETYCSAEPNSYGCTSAITFSGSPSVSSASRFVVGAREVIGQTSGFCVYGLAPALPPFSGSTLCVARPGLRTAMQGSGGSATPPVCSGTFAIDFGALIQAGSDPFLVPGTIVYAQFVYADPGDPEGVSMSNAVAFVIAP